MINLRFHIVSLVAVFLALAIGIAVGATVVDQGLVSQSQRRIASLDRTLEDRAVAIRDLKNENAALDAFGEQSEDRMVSDRLLAKSVLFVTDGAIDDDRTAELANTLRSAGARVLGTLAIGPSLRISAPQELERARVAVGATSTRPDTVRFLVGQRMGLVAATRLWKHKQTIGVRRLTNDRAVGGDHKLNIRKMPLQPEADLPLPFRVKMGVDFVDQDDPAALDE